MCSAASTESTNRTTPRKPTGEKPAGSFTIAATEPSKTSPRRAESLTAVPNHWGLPCSTATVTAGPTCWWPTILSPTSFIATNTTVLSSDVAVEAGLAFSSEGKARAGMGIDVADFDNSGAPGIAITNFDNEMIALYRATGRGYEDIAAQAGVGMASPEQPRLRL